VAFLQVHFDLKSPNILLARWVGMVPVDLISNLLGTGCRLRDDYPSACPLACMPACQQNKLPALPSLCSDGTAKIADVGMAKVLQRDYVTGVVSTLAWWVGVAGVARVARVAGVAGVARGGLSGRVKEGEGLLQQTGVVSTLAWWVGVEGSWVGGLVGKREGKRMPTPTTPSP